MCFNNSNCCSPPFLKVIRYRYCHHLNVLREHLKYYSQTRTCASLRSLLQCYYLFVFIYQKTPWGQPKLGACKWNQKWAKRPSSIGSWLSLIFSKSWKPVCFQRVFSKVLVCTGVSKESSWSRFCVLRTKRSTGIILCPEFLLPLLLAWYFDIHKCLCVQTTCTLIY